MTSGEIDPDSSAAFTFAEDEEEEEEEDGGDDVLSPCLLRDCLRAVSFVGGAVVVVVADASPETSVDALLVFFASSVLVPLDEAKKRDFETHRTGERKPKCSARGGGGARRQQRVGWRERQVKRNPSCTKRSMH